MFNFEIPKDCKKALNELKKLKVFKLRNDDSEENFADVYYNIRHEVDLFEGDEYTNELTQASYKSSKKWIDNYKYLYEKYNNK